MGKQVNIPCTDNYCDGVTEKAKSAAVLPFKAVGGIFLVNPEGH